MAAGERFELLYGKNSIEKMKESTILIAGLGGVGSFCTEAIVRSFCGKVIIIDYDTYEESNLNRQLYSSVNNIGKFKVDVLEENLREINHISKIIKYNIKIGKENIETIFINDKIDFVIDAIDDITGKIHLIEYCKNNNINIISSMGAANRYNPEMLKIEDIKNTYNCPLAKIMRKELKNKNINDLKVVFSSEKPIKLDGKLGSSIFVPASAGILLSSYVVNYLLKG